MNRRLTCVCWQILKMDCSHCMMWQWHCLNWLLWEMCIWLGKSPLNVGICPDPDSGCPDSGVGLGLPLGRSALSACFLRDVYLAQESCYWILEFVRIRTPDARTPDHLDWHHLDVGLPTLFCAPVYHVHLVYLLKAVSEEKAVQKHICRVLPVV